MSSFKRVLAALLALAMALSFALPLAACSGEYSPSTGISSGSSAGVSQSQGGTGSGTALAPQGDSYAYAFRSQRQLNDHYSKHGREMGYESPGAYERAASRVATNPTSLHKIEKEDGDDVYYLVTSNEFVVISTDGYIRTYFCPDSGKRYFDRQ